LVETETPVDLSMPIETHSTPAGVDHVVIEPVQLPFANVVPADPNQAVEPGNSIINEAPIGSGNESEVLPEQSIEWNSSNETGVSPLYSPINATPSGENSSTIPTNETPLAIIEAEPQTISNPPPDNF